MSQPPFNPFEAQFDRDAALSILRDAVAGADDGEGSGLNCSKHTMY